MLVEGEVVTSPGGGVVEDKDDNSSHNNVASKIEQIDANRNGDTDTEVNDSTHQLDEDEKDTAQHDIRVHSEDMINQNDLIDEGECDADVSNDERVEQQETAHNSMQDASASDNYQEATEEDLAAETLEADIDNDAPFDSQSSETADDPVEADNSGSGGEQPLENLILDSAVETIDSSPPPHSEDGDQLFPTDDSASNQLLDHEILFDEGINNIALFSEVPADCMHNEQLPTSQHRITGVLSFTSPVMRVFPARYFWSASVYEKKTLAIFTNPDIIVILRVPKNMYEVHQLLAMRGESGSSTRDINDYLVAESVIDPKTCKIRLSQLTTPTSVPLPDISNASLPHRITNMNKNDNRKHTCFDILTPTETVSLSAVVESTGENSLNDTHRCEFAIVSALMKVHVYNFSLGGDDDQAWKHQVILGTPHSYVISGNDQLLKESLAGAIEFQNSRSGCNSKKLDPFIIDAKDDSGKTALHHACSRRKVSTVRLLVEAGADCSIPQNVDDLTPCHICAKGLDEKILSTLLSASHPTRPDPNALDCLERTPMYLAAVEGRGVDGRNNSEALNLCLSALEAWGGQLMVDSLKGIKLLHPVHVVSEQWKSDELLVILAHCKYRYPLIPRGSDSGCSLGAQFQYPIHASIASLKKKIQSTDSNNELMPVESLIKTLQTLLDHGFEPNERIESIVGQGEAVQCLSCFIGFTPLQLLSVVAMEARSEIDLKARESDENNLELPPVLRHISKIVQASAELLLLNGARISMPSPPSSRLNRPTLSGYHSLAMTLEDPKIKSSRECLPLDRNELVALFGGVSRVNSALKAFKSKSVKVADACEIGSTSIDSDAPGGSDSISCAICWSEFGVVSHRKHLCRASRKFVCHECSTKRVVVNGTEHRISDGQYLLAIADTKKAAEKIKAGQAKQLFNGATNETTETHLKDRFANAMSGLGQAKNAVIERGAKLENLAEKSEALEQASLDFANMAKELNRSQNSWW
ncbi:hypothetical protein ACHAWU_006551 [Discostella pseudostelligera]|uniref:V-SNARE coiled-coil homology domain-containing protein n=1 Tax=Discostella pseudostelligera TaxID=259834 RepID=A0ABD3MBU2_9STRA